MKKYFIIISTILLLLTGMEPVYATNSNGDSLNNTRDAGELVIVLDPGHDSTHAGAGGNGLREEIQVLKIGLYLKEELSKYENVKVYMTRETESCAFPETCGIKEGSKRCNEARVAFAKNVGADVFIALHLNAAGNTGAKGALAFVPNNNYSAEAGAIGQELGRTIVNKLAELGLENDGIVIKESAADTAESEYYYPDGSIADYYRVIRYAKKEYIPAIIVEHGFISNTSDAINYLTTDEQLKALAIKDAQGIVEYYGLSLKEGCEASPNPEISVTPVPTPQPTPVPEPEPEPTPETESEAVTETESETQSEVESESEPDTETQSEIETETEESIIPEETETIEGSENEHKPSILPVLAFVLVLVAGTIGFVWYKNKK